jgi:hypothetical protein
MSKEVRMMKSEERALFDETAFSGFGFRHSLDIRH